ncbi:MAG: PLP-dependent aminotransferase family protein [Pedosphaera sp.]|nr:PLP-dependent aminotransferase family protein [Pedosphaera sp.]
MLTNDLASHAVEQTGADAPLYERVAVRISELIEHGTLRPGERVPSVRKYSEQQDVSIATVMQAYRLLEDRGIIEARPQSGYYVRTRRWELPPEPAMYRPKPKATNVRTSELVLNVVKAARIPGVVPLGATMPNPELFPIRELNRAMAAACRRAPHISHGYSPPAGGAILRHHLAQRAMEAGCTLSPDDLIVTCGATEALNLCLRAVAKPGDVIAIESPTFFGILQIIEALGMRVCEIPSYPREGVCLDELESRLKSCRIKACVFTLNFSNPLGSCMPDEKKKRLVEMLAEREIPLIEDDIYGNLAFAPTRPKSAKAFDTDGWVMSCDSFSKTLAPGFRVGWVAPGRFRQKVEFLKLVTTHSTASPTQLAMGEFLRNGGYDHHLRKLRRLYAAQSCRMIDAVGRHFPEGTRVSRPTGGMALWVELPAHLRALDVYERALAEKISIAPGPIFSAKQGFQNFLRLNFANPWSDKIENAILKLGKIMAGLSPRPVVVNGN